MPRKTWDSHREKKSHHPKKTILWRSLVFFIQSLDIYVRGSDDYIGHYGERSRLPECGKSGRLRCFVACFNAHCIRLWRLMLRSCMNDPNGARQKDDETNISQTKRKHFGRSNRMRIPSARSRAFYTFTRHRFWSHLDSHSLKNGPREPRMPINSKC